MTKTKEEWVVVSSIEKMLTPASRREYATHSHLTGEWIGWTTPGYRCRTGNERDSYGSLKEALDLVRQVRIRGHVGATAVCLRDGRSVAGAHCARCLERSST